MKGILLVIAGALAAAPIYAQTPASPSQANDQLVQRRYQIRVMEAVLVGAVQHGAEQMGRQMQALNPNLMLLTGSAQARGFVLPGYGVFFDVEVPALRRSLAWSVQTLELDRSLADSLRLLHEQLVRIADQSMRTEVEQALKRLELQLGPMPALPTAPSRSVAERGGTVSAALSPEETAPAPQVLDPNELYTSAVRRALIDAMLDHSGPMGIQPDEWLTVAARDATGPLVPGGMFDAMTIMLRTKGSDLAAFRAQRITLEEARKRVEVHEF